MARPRRKILWTRSFRRTLSALTRNALRTGSKAVRQTLRAAPVVRKRAPAKRTAAHWSTGLAAGAAGARRYRLYTPPGVQRTERLPLLVMLHGCWQDAEALAASSQMNRVAARERFLVLYPEQDRLANAQACWNWYDTRSGRAQGEADIIDAAIDQVCLLYAVDPLRIALAGLSAGAGMAALLATRRPERFRAVAMHSGVGPGVAHSSATALRAMRGRRASHEQFVSLARGTCLPALLVIHGGAEAARHWASHAGAKPGAPRTVQRGARYATTITDYRCRGRLVASLCEVNGLGHAWSGGAAAQGYSDPKGPDASRMIWSFVAKQFAGGAA